MKFFEEKFYTYVTEFCEMLTSNADPITSDTIDFYKKFNRREWIDTVTDDERKEKKMATTIGEVERTHFTLMFFIDMLSFTSHFMLKVPENFAKPESDNKRNPKD